MGGLHLEAGITDLAAKENRVYLATHGGLEVIDVAMPEAPRRLGRMELLVGELSIDLLGERVLVVGPEAGLLVIDVSSPAEPRQLGGLSLEGAQALAVSEDLVYVAGGGGPLWVVDLSDPSRPRLRGVRMISSLCETPSGHESSGVWMASSTPVGWSYQRKWPTHPFMMATMRFGC